MEIPQTANYVIVGGGVMGASTAYHLAARGETGIILLEKEEFFGQGATGRCAGGVRYQFATEVNIRLSLASLPMLERFAEEIGQEVDYRQIGYLFLLTNEKDIKVFEHNVTLQNKLGVNTEWLSGDEVRKHLPIMNLEDVQKATLHPKDGLVDPNSVVMGYVNRAIKMDVRCFNQVEVTGITQTSGRVSSVQTNKGEIETPVVINCAGPWAGKLAGLAEVEVPITPIRRQMMTTTALPELPRDFPFVIDFAQSLYFHPEGAGLLTGMSNPDEKPGFDQSVDLGFELVNLERAIERMPLLEKAGMASHWAGLYEVTPDAHPIYGSTPLEGFYVVAGFSGHGFMHGPISGKLISEIILDGAASSVDVSMLDLARFDESRLIKEYNVI